MKTPDEIKKGLKRHLCNDDEDCVSICYKDGCPYLDDARNGELTCGQLICNDTIVYIQQLETIYSQVSKALCGKENATLEELLQEASQVKSRLAQVERERDAMSYDMHQLQGALCAYCENLYRPDGSEKVSCKVFGDGYGEKDGSPLICGRFKWRGVCEENTHDQPGL